jgi:hypothetical protein
MSFTVEQFSHAIAASNFQARPDGDQRRRSRAGLDSDASIIPLANGDGPGATTVSVRDVSASGIGFLHHRCMALDEEFALLLPQADDTPAIILCSVIFWQPLVPGIFAIGARFVRVLRDAVRPLPLHILPVLHDHAAFVPPMRRAS